MGEGRNWADRQAQAWARSQASGGDSDERGHFWALTLTHPAGTGPSRGVRHKLGAGNTGKRHFSFHEGTCSKSQVPIQTGTVCPHPCRRLPESRTASSAQLCPKAGTLPDTHTQ